MSVDAIVYARRVSTAPDGQRLTTGEKHLLLVIATHINPSSQTAWMSIETLARETHYSTRHVKRIVGSLLTKGAIRRVPSRNGSPTPHYAIPAVSYRAAQTADGKLEESYR